MATPAELAAMRRAVELALLEGGPTLGPDGRAGPPVRAGAGIETIAGALRLELVDVTRVGPEVRLTARRPAVEGSV